MQARHLAHMVGLGRVIRTLRVKESRRERRCGPRATERVCRAILALAGRLARRVLVWDRFPMGTLVRDILMQSLADLRYEPVPKRIRARLGGRVVIDTDRAVLVWEPKRVVPSYGVPVEEVAGILEPPPDPLSWRGWR